MFKLQEEQHKTKTGYPIIFRNDDVNPNTDFVELSRIYQAIKEYFPDARIVQGVNFFASHKGIEDGSVYQDEVPFKDNPPNWFYYVNNMLKEVPRFSDVDTASHGLFHVDHARIHIDAQEMSIVSSCELLGTKLFIPPFGRWNEDTKRICDKNGIYMLNSREWKSLEHNEFNKKHRLWYFHSWRWNVKTFRKYVWRIPSVKEKALQKV